jgi:hypothetical protein
MINTTYFKRFGTFALTLVMFMGVSFAEGGDDDDKKGDKSNKVNKVVLTDSIVLDLDDDIVNSDDTLVFEDWENPDDLNGNGGVPMGGDNGMNGNGNGNTYGNLFDAAGADLGHVFKKDYQVDFTLFPNPTVNAIHLKPSIEPSSIRIADITGKEHKIALYTPQVDVTELPAGTYFIQLIYADHIEARKFIKS